MLYYQNIRKRGLEYGIRDALDFAENDYKFLAINYRNHVIAIVMGACSLWGFGEKYS